MNSLGIVLAGRLNSIDTRRLRPRTLLESGVGGRAGSASAVLLGGEPWIYADRLNSR
ncbi:hypothetical protein [Nonomuraea insulae]|uniref:Uncharacterized protein n=1 Tax=Nonomuraea insulae TaxID=1616787 RepID=A0ABW1CKD6_9ACTN